MQMVDCNPFPRQEVLVCPNPPLVIAQCMAVNGEEMDVPTLLSQMTLSEDSINGIAQATVLQAESTEWKQQRKGRITASNFHFVNAKMLKIQSGQEVQTKSIVDKILGIGPELNNKAVKHGRSMESHAKIAYRRYLTKKHKHVKVRDTGLIICKDAPFLAASPDLVVSCSCHPSGLCEIKCPYSIREQVPTKDNYSHFDGDGKLKQTSPYYAQVQGQMGILGFPYCDFFVYTHHGYHVQRIQFNDHSWVDMKQHLSKFWTLFVAPAILNLQSLEEDMNVDDDHAYGANSDAIVDDSDVVFCRSTKGPLTKSDLHKTTS
jgi:hypothetical protein